MRLAPALLQPLLAGGAPAGASVEHAGELSWRDFPALAHRVKAHLAAGTLAPNQGRRAFSAFVEVVYNVLHHGLAADETPGDPGRRVPARIALGTRDGLIWIAAANLVPAEAAPELERRLRGLAANDPERAHRDYRDALVRTGARAGTAPGREGGLGLLTLARDAARPIQFELAPVGGGAVLFRLEVTV